MLALLVSLVVAAAVLVPLADADWDVARWAVGCWFAVAVAALGFLGGLKALMTHPATCGDRGQCRPVSADRRSPGSGRTQPGARG